MRREKGMTLLEVLVAIVILAISFVLLIRTHIQSYTMVAESEILNRAVLLEDSLCARMEAFGWTDVSARRGYAEGPPRLFYLTKVENSPYPGVKKLVIKVSRERGGKPITELTRWMVAR